MSARRVLLVYGNCQAEVIAMMVGKTRAAKLFDVVYLRSFDHPFEGHATLSADLIERCAILWQQRDYIAFPYENDIPPDAATIVFPSLDLNLLWPFNAVNPFNRPEPPDFPFGRFHYGDRIVIDGVRADLGAGEILERVLHGWNARPFDLDRFLKIEQARLAARDADCDVRMGAFTLANFASTRLFFTRDHPTLAFLTTLGMRLLESSCAAEPRLASIDLRDAIGEFITEPLGEYAVPIHPEVARHFALSWYREDDLYGPRDTPIPYREYFEAMIRHALAMHNESTTSVEK